MFNESNDTLGTAIDSGITFGSSGVFRANGNIGDNYADVPLYQPDFPANVSPFLTLRRLDVDMLRFELLAGQVISVDIDAWEKGTFLDSTLRLFDEQGVQLAISNNAAAPGEQFHQSQFDPYLRFVVPEDGTYYVGISAGGNTTYDPFDAGSGTSASDEGRATMRSLLPSVVARPNPCNSVTAATPTGSGTRDN